MGNCHQLNAAPAYFDGGLVELKVVGKHSITSTRNNDFSNRSQKATIIVSRRGIMGYLHHSPPLHLAIAIAMALATLVLIYSISTALYAYKNPTSSLFSKKRRPLLLRLPCLHGMVAAKELERQNYKQAFFNNLEQPQTGI